MAITRKIRVHLGYETPNLPNQHLRPWDCIKDLLLPPNPAVVPAAA